MTFKIWGTEDLTRTGAQDDVVTTLPNGGYVAVYYATGVGLLFQMYDGAGLKVGAPVPVPTGTARLADNFDVQTIGSNGQFAVTWTEPGNPNSVKSHVFNIDGSRVTQQAMTVADIGGSSTGSTPSIAATDTGGFVTVYNHSDDGKVKLTVQDASGNVIGTPVIVSVQNGAERPSITHIGGSQYVVSYRTTVHTDEDPESGVKYKLVDISSNPPTVSARVHVGDGLNSDVIGLKDANGTLNGQFAVAFTNGANVKVAIYKGGDPITVDLTTAGWDPGNNEYVDATALKGGRIAFVYTRQNGTDTADIFLRTVDSNGSMSAELLINGSAATDGNIAQTAPSIEEMTDGRLAITWHDNNGKVSTNIVDAREAAVTVNGTAGDDVYAGSDYNGNVLNGHAGNDKLIGGSGTDAMDGGVGTDTASYEKALAGVTASLAARGGAGGDAAGDTYANIENLTGSNFGDSLTGDDGANALRGLGGDDILSGGGGADILIGGAGNDTYYIDSFDQVLEAAGEGLDTVLSGTSLNLAAFANIESVIITGAGPVSIIGTGEANTLNGNVGNDTIRSGAGNDTVGGGSGRDQLFGDSGDDTIRGDAGNDKIYGNLGNDIMAGGSGKDIFVFDLRANKTTNRDQILDFSVRDDSIHLENKYFGKLGKKGSANKPAKINQDSFKVGNKAQDKDDYLIYNKKTGVLYYDADGSGRSKAVDVAVLKKGLSLKYTDFFMI